MRGIKRFIQLDATQEKAIQEGYTGGKSAPFRQRCHMILLSHQGKQIQQIADIFQCRYQTVLKWFDRFDKQGLEGLRTAKGRGRRPIIRTENEAEVERIKQIVGDHPQQLKQALPRIKEEFGHDLSEATLKRFLKKTVMPTNACAG